MKPRELPKVTRTALLLGELYPHLLQLKDTEEHGVRGQLEIVYKGFLIKYVGELPKEITKVEKEVGDWQNLNLWNDGWEQDNP